MSIKYYTLTELKQLALDDANLMGVTTYTSADDAYNYASARCGYENPASLSDTDYYLQQHWLLVTMKLYFLNDAKQRYRLKFDVGDLKLGQVNRELRADIEALEKSFEEAKIDSKTAHIFINAVEYFGQVVLPSGIIDDAIGQDVSHVDFD